MEVLKNNMNRDKLLCYEACKNADAIRFNKENDDFRPPFFKDADRIIYSLSYTRYIDKTQVFSGLENDHISKRMTHVQMVSKVARTIGRALNLNEDLIEAAALGHDIGHVPFGHVGEKILNKISLEVNEGYFNHNVQSVREFMFLEKNGEGLNLTVQTLDGMLCHNGEIELPKYEPKKKTPEEFLKEYESCYLEKDAILKLRPMTLEGCVVRISDIIAYLGRDIEDAIMLGLLKVEDIPKSITDVVGSTNSQIINTFVLDIIKNSYGHNYILLSDKVFKALKDLKKFNYEYIYDKASTIKEREHWEEMFTTVFNHSLKKINDSKSEINKIFLSKMSKKYIDSTTDERKVIDYIAGMTDDFLIKQYKLIISN
ncbi:MAG: HD domain-containing protein [Bacilli bacterium]|nr:HD domain-containing protein [Bacilli bacterium]